MASTHGPRTSGRPFRFLQLALGLAFISFAVAQGEPYHALAGAAGLHVRGYWADILEQV